MSAIESDSYRRAGVDIAAGEAFVRAIRPAIDSTRRPGSETEIQGFGGFAGAFDPLAAGYRDPILMAATDGVGTKLRIAAAMDRHQGIGIDLVAMCVNDLLAAGAEPLFFLDYFATGRLDPASAQRIVEGIAQGCREAGCALIGGETAEMPGHYAAGHYDLAGFAVGAIERGDIFTRLAPAAGDRLIGLASSGLHANGFSLVRQIVADRGLDYAGPAPFASGEALGESLLTPTRLYVKPLLAPLRAGRIKAMAHITGGGIAQNLPRVLPNGLAARLEAAAWELPPVFRWLRDQGDLGERELARTFNCGIGMILAVDPDAGEALRGELSIESWPIGTIVAGDGDVRWAATPWRG